MSKCFFLFLVAGLAAHFCCVLPDRSSAYPDEPAPAAPGLSNGEPADAAEGVVGGDVNQVFSAQEITFKFGGHIVQTNREIFSFDI